MNENITRFVTFYSYKGGVGRTSALVNVAILQALRGNNILILDFDLEAPGTCPYLKKLNPEYDDDREGLLEYFVASIEEERVPPLYDKAFDLTPQLGSKNGGRLWVLNAGNTHDPAYTSRLEKLRWSEIFRQQFGELLLKNFKNQIMDEFGRPDYVLIDSRTGITETGGVCTRYLADTIVILTSLNEQNINGTAMIFKELAQEGKETVLVAANVPVGMPYGEDQLFVRRIQDFQRGFGRRPDLFIYYSPVLSLSEELPGLVSSNDHPNGNAPAIFSTDPLLQAYRQLAQKIDIDREEEISYLPSIRESVKDLRRFTSVAEVPLSVETLKQYYSDRLLTGIVLNAFEFMKECLERSNSPETWDRSSYQRLITAARGTSNSWVKELPDILQNFAYQLIQRYLGSGRKMDSLLEEFFEPNVRNRLVLQQISNHQFEWPIGYLKRSLDCLKPDDHAPIACALFNLSHCLLKTGETAMAKELLARFLVEFKKLVMAKHPPFIRANFYFAAALASKVLGRINDAEEMRKKSEESLSVLKPDAFVFSPVTFKIVHVPEFRKQLEMFSTTEE